LRWEGEVAVVTFDVPGAKVNMLSAAVMADIARALDALEDRVPSAAVFRSAKPDVFIAGADLSELRGIGTPADAREKAHAGQALFDRVAKLPCATIAVIDGACLGGGLEFALACRHRLVTDAPKTQLGLPEVTLGIIPGWGGTQRLPRLLGLLAGMDLILNGKPVDGRKAFKLGLADAVVAREFLDIELPAFIARCLDPAERAKMGGRVRPRGMAAVMEKVLTGNPLGRMVVYGKARKLLAVKARGMPAPVVALEVIAKTWGGRGSRVVPALGLLSEQEGFAGLAGTEASRCLVDSFLAGESLKKEWSPAKGAALPAVKQVGVLGAGVMGGGIAWLCAHHDLPVRLKDLTWDALAKGWKAADGCNRALIGLRKLTANEAALRMQRISGTVDWRGYHGCDAVIEAVVEDLGIKRKVLADLETRVAPGALIASNTSSLSIAAMASAMARPGRFVGLHFFNPVNRMPLVEVVAGPATSPETVQRAVALARKLGKTPVVVQDCPGFLVNRILLPYLNEAAFLLQDGADPCVLDHVIEGFGMPMGPCALIDAIGIDTGAKVVHLLEAGYGERMAAAPLLGHLAAQPGMLGAKGGKGFLVYEHGKAVGPNPEIAHLLGDLRRHLKAEVSHPGAQEMVERCMLAMVNEAARCLAEGVVGRAAWLDLAMVLGTGFPPWRGGPLHYADALGARTVVERLRALEQRFGARFAPAPLLIAVAQRGGARICDLPAPLPAELAAPSSVLSAAPAAVSVH
jgi:3-hydroxyacyl-CoA dehydrogenase/enoyl-CoA hydratase/3-hydroxybutyryl-CoA epimerase